MKHFTCILTLSLLTFLSTLQAQINNTKTRPFFANNHSNSATGKQTRSEDIFAPTHSVNFFWESDKNQWMQVDTSYYSYNSSGYLSTQLERNWVLNRRSFLSYDAKGRLTEKLIQYYSNNTWVDNDKFVYIYDSNDNLIESSHLIFNIVSNQWETIDGTRFIYVYNNNSQTLIYTKQNWNAGWKNNMRIKDSFSLANRLVQKTIEKWNGTIFENSYRYIDMQWLNWTGDSSTSAISSYSVENWGFPLSNQWNLTERNVTTYDSSGSWISISDLINLFDGSWMNAYRYSYNYDLNKNYSGYREEYWNYDSIRWDINDELKITHSYVSGTSKNIAKTVWQTWQPTVGALVNNQMKIYSDYILVAGISVNKVSEFQVSVYPNPFNDYCTFIINSKEFNSENDLNLCVYDLLGNIVSQSKFEEEKTRIQRENLQAGIYFYSITDQSNIIHQGKLVIE